MASTTPPPIYAPMVDQDGIVTLPWILFFNGDFSGDAGTAWTPSFTGLSSVGTPSFSGFYYRVSEKLTYFTATVSPGTNTSATAGTTFINNFPLFITATGSCSAVSGNVGGLAGMIQANSNNIFVPGWSNLTLPVTVCGIAEVE